MSNAVLTHDPSTPVAPRGFTLTRLLAVIAAVGVLSAFAPAPPASPDAAPQAAALRAQIAQAAAARADAPPRVILRDSGQAGHHFIPPRGVEP